MKVLKRRSHKLSKPISFNQALKERVAHRNRHLKSDAPHESTARDIAVEDGQVPPMVHYTDVKMP